MQGRSLCHSAALEYARRGFYVFPLEPGGKAPLTALVRHGKDDATKDPTVIDMWWHHAPDANLGIACEPSGLVVLDVDVGEYKDKNNQTQLKQGWQSFNDIKHELTDTLVANTAGGGLHVYYLRDEGESLQRIGFKPGLDLIGKGYVVAPPSARADGKSYSWRHHAHPVKLPPMLRHYATLAKETKKLDKIDAREPIPPGGRNIALYRLGAALRDTGIGKEALTNALHFENQQRCQPPLDDHELKAIVDSILTRVQPTRDVAAGAVVADEIRAIVTAPPPTSSAWIYEVSEEEFIPTRFFSTGFPDLDILMGGGLASRQVCGIIGPPSTGKSAWVGSVVKHLQGQTPVLHVSTELPRTELFVRYAASELEFPWRDGLSGKFPRAEMARAVKDLRIKMIGSDNLDRTNAIAQIRYEAQQMLALHGTAPAIAVDYVQLLARGSTDRKELVGELTMQLRILSQDLDCPVLAVFSTQRATYSEDRLVKLREMNDPTVYLGLAKESGDVEFDCATMLFLDLDRTHEGQPKPARIPVARCRVGDVGFAGARANLAVGKWWSDPSVLAEMSPENASKKRGSSNQQDQLMVWTFLSNNPGRPWKELKMATGLSDDRLRKARAGLLQQGKLKLEIEKGFDENHRATKTEVWRAVGISTPSPSVESVENDVINRAWQAENAWESEEPDEQE